MQVVNGKQIANTDQPKLNNATDAVVVSIYGLITCAQPTSDTVSERFGRKSTAAIVTHVPMGDLIIESTIWARLQPLSDGSGQQVTFEAGLPKNVKFQGEEAKERFHDAVNAAALAWVGYEKATAGAASRLLGEKAKDSKRVVLAPRLVKAVSTAARAN